MRARLRNVQNLAGIFLITLALLAMGLIGWDLANGKLVFGATTANVTVNATPAYVVITCNETDYDFGVVTAGSTDNTTTTYFSISNNSTVGITITIKSSNWYTLETNNWTYGEPAEDTGNFTAWSDNSSDWDIVIEENTPVNLVTGVPVSTNVSWGLLLNAPTSFTYGDAQSANLTLTAASE